MTREEEQKITREDRQKFKRSNGIRRKKLQYPDWDACAVPLDQMASNRRLVRGLALMKLSDSGVYEDW